NRVPFRGRAGRASPNPKAGHPPIGPDKPDGAPATDPGSDSACICRRLARSPCDEAPTNDRSGYMPRTQPLFSRKPQFLSHLGGGFNHPIHYLVNLVVRQSPARAAELHFPATEKQPELAPALEQVER